MQLKCWLLLMFVLVSAISHTIFSQELETTTEQVEEITQPEALTDTEHTAGGELPQYQKEPVVVETVTEQEAKVEKEPEKKSIDIVPEAEQEAKVKREHKEHDYKKTVPTEVVEKEEEKTKTSTEKKSQYRHALGVAAGFLGGYGMSYKYYFRPDLSVQLTGLGHGHSDGDMIVNFGGMISRAIHTGRWESLLLSFAASVKREWHADSPDQYYFWFNESFIDQTVKKLGILVGIQVYSSNIGMTLHFGNMLAHTNFHQTNREDVYSVLPTIDASVHYYFR